MDFFTLLPLLLSLGIIILTRRTMLALLLGAVVGAVLFVMRVDDSGNLFSYLWGVFWRAVSNDWHYSAFYFTIVLGGFAALMQAGGGLSRLFQGVQSPRGLELRVIGLGVLCFFDGLANSLLLGRIGRPLADRVGVSREKLAYLADTTSSSVACLAPISTWIAMQLGLIRGAQETHGIEGSPYAVFLASLPYNFYCLLSLGLALLLVFSQKNFGPMSRAVALEAEERVSERGGGLVTPLMSLGVLLISIPLLYYLLATEVYLPVTFTKLTEALGSSQGPVVFMLASTLSLLLLIVLTRSLSIGQRLTAVGDGMRKMLLPLGVLICAWLFGSVMSDLGLGAMLAETLNPGENLRWFPAVIFLMGCVLSFSTGSSWGTMALLFPLCTGMLEGVAEEQVVTLLPIISAAIFSGSVFGDHCSPYSDTTIVSAISAGCSTYDHVRTQLPYAMVSGVLAAGLFLLSGWLLIAS